MAKSAKKVAIRPLGDKVLVQRLAAAEVSAGGIVLPESAKEKPAEGMVIALGEGRLLGICIPKEKVKHLRDTSGWVFGRF